MSYGQTKSRLERAKRFLSEDVFDAELHSLSRIRRAGISVIRVLRLIYKGFMEDECPLYASALTLISLMSIVPIFAFALALLRGLGAGEHAERQIVQSMQVMPEQFREFMRNVLDLVGRTNFTTLGGIGLVFLLVTVVMVIGSVEQSFNRVWGVSNPRRFLGKISSYISILIVVPVLVTAATTINAVLMSPGIAGLIQAKLGPASFLYLRSRTMTPLAATWLAFIFLYKFMPNTHVRPMPAILSGIVGGTLWMGWQWFYINLQVGVNQYNKIYGTFASIPIFLIWLLVSWQIVLLGAEIGFALQNYSTYNREQRALSASAQSKTILALSIMCRAAQSMLNELPQFEAADYARTHLVPIRLINEVVNVLCAAGLLAPVAESNGRFILARLPDKVKTSDIINAVLQAGSSPESLGLRQLHPSFNETFQAIKKEGAVNGTLADLARLVSTQSSPG